MHGLRLPLVGQIPRDMCLIDLTAVPQACAGDEVAWLGAPDSERMLADDIAGRCDRIACEALCAISQCVPRRYVLEACHAADV